MNEVASVAENGLQKFPLKHITEFMISLDSEPMNKAGTGICDVLIDGVFVRQNSEFTFLDEAAIIAHAREWCDCFNQDDHRMKRANEPMFHHLYNQIYYLRGRHHDPNTN